MASNSGLPKGSQATSSTAGPNKVFSKRPGAVNAKPQMKNTGDTASKMRSV